MAEPSHLPEPSQLRVSDADRHRVAEILREAAGEGRLDMDELDQRLEATYAAKVYADLVPITVDLPDSGVPAPVHPPAPPQPQQRAANLPIPTTTHETSIAIFGGTTRKGVWMVPVEHTAFAMFGGVDLDLREAQFAEQEVTITANAIMAGIDIIVDEYTHVVVEGVGIMGGFEQARDRVDPQITPDSPVVRIRGFALMGGVTVTRKGPPKRRQRRKGLV